MNVFYQSFLLRMWKTDRIDSPAWQASLEDPQTRTIKTFQDPEALFNYLIEIANLSESENESESKDRIE